MNRADSFLFGHFGVKRSKSNFKFIQLSSRPLSPFLYLSVECFMIMWLVRSQCIIIFEMDAIIQCPKMVSCHSKLKKNTLNSVDFYRFSWLPNYKWFQVQLSICYVPFARIFICFPFLGPNSIDIASRACESSQILVNEIILLQNVKKTNSSKIKRNTMIKKRLAH